MRILFRPRRWYLLALAFLTPAWNSQGGDGIRTAGDILQFALPGAAAGLTLAYWDGPGALEFGESAALTLGITYALKYSISDKRPNGARQSFPSGHTSISFSAAEFMRERYGLEYGIPAYALASFVAYSRVESREHDADDVVVGAAIGIASSYLFTKPYRGWHIELDGGTRHWGFRLTRTF